MTTSNATFDECRLISRNGYSGFGQFVPSFGPALTIADSAASLTRTSLTGAGWIAGSAGCGSPAIQASDSLIGLGAGCRLTAGVSVSRLCATPALMFTGTGALVVDPSTTLVPWFAQAIVGIVPVSRFVPGLTAGDFVLGSTVAGALEINTGDLFAVLAGFARAPVFFAPLDGGLGLDVAQPLITLAAGASVTGQEAWSIALPSLPHLAGAYLGVQAVAGPDRVVLSNPLLRVLR